MKVHCPYHEDANPSCEVYENGGHCFVCGVSVPLSALGLEGAKINVRPKENLAEKLAYISGLPVGQFRGFHFPYDSRGFYLVWPEGDYYKQRLFDESAKSRYLGPAGYKPPLFWASRRRGGTLLISEGELDALSAACCCPTFSVASPGASSNFSSKMDLTPFLKYDRVVIAVDSDGAGIKAGRELAASLLYRVPSLSVIYKNLDNDFNDILVKFGKEALREEIEQGMLKAVSWQTPAGG